MCILFVACYCLLQCGYLSSLSTLSLFNYKQRHLPLPISNPVKHTNYCSRLICVGLFYKNEKFLCLWMFTIIVRVLDHQKCYLVIYGQDVKFIAKFTTENWPNVTLQYSNFRSHIHFSHWYFIIPSWQLWSCENHDLNTFLLNATKMAFNRDPPPTVSPIIKLVYSRLYI